MIRDFVIVHLGLMYEIAEIFELFVLIVLGCGLLIARFDGLSRENAIYLAFVTAFTVGFGDVTPRTRGARFTLMLAFLGLVLMGVLVAVSATAPSRCLDEWLVVRSRTRGSFT